MVLCLGLLAASVQTSSLHGIHGVAEEFMHVFLGTKLEMFSYSLRKKEVFTLISEKKERKLTLLKALLLNMNPTKPVTRWVLQKSNHLQMKPSEMTHVAAH